MNRREFVCGAGTLVAASQLPVALEAATTVTTPPGVPFTITSIIEVVRDKFIVQGEHLIHNSVDVFKAPCISILNVEFSMGVEDAGGLNPGDIIHIHDDKFTEMFGEI